MNARISDTTTDREILTTRVFDAPRELVYAAFLDPQHISRWWGPNGFRTTTYEMEVRPGGVWRFTMHGPDGTDYPNVITYREVVRNERLAYDHGGDPDHADFENTITFTDEAGKTRVTMRAVFTTVAQCQAAIKFGAPEGGQQTLARLGEQLLGMTDDSLDDFVLVRVFDAPRELVWKVWTDAQHLARWWGPTGFTIGVHELDLRNGGTFHYSMRSPDGHEMWGKFVFREITPTTRIRFVNSFSDPAGGVTRHPGAPEWPAEILNDVTFQEHEGQTTLILRGVPIHASPAERRTFRDGHKSMEGGFGGTFAQLSAYLAELRR
jgi:uncharacterized protein YndB with AHSA1/START domain